MKNVHPGIDMDAGTHRSDKLHTYSFKTDHHIYIHLKSSRRLEYQNLVNWGIAFFPFSIILTCILKIF